MIVYLAEPIDFAIGMDRSEANHIANILAGQDMCVFRPALAWLGPAVRPEHTDQQVVGLNRAALDAATLVVAALPSSHRSIGVPMEIAWATAHGKPVVVLTDSHSAMLNGNPLVVTIDRTDMLLWAVREARKRADELANRVSHEPAQPLPYAFTGGSTGWPVDGDHRGLHRAYPDDAGLDLFTTQDVQVPPGKFTFIPCGVRVKLPDDAFGWVVARSSTMGKWGLIVPPGVIDSGFEGELGVPAYRVAGWPHLAPEDADRQPSDGAPEQQHTIPAGTRLAQLVLLPNITRKFAPSLAPDAFEYAVAPIHPHQPPRGTNGFGSTGVNAPASTNDHDEDGDGALSQV
jgi:dUTPase